MLIQELHLEMTRNCTLCCEHCLRGDKACININKEVIDNIFNDVKSVHTLLLTGVELLLAVYDLEYLIHVLVSKNIRIDRIVLGTNGTVLSSRVLNILKNLRNIAPLIIGVSNDIFHMLELERLNFLELRNKNTEVLKQLFDAKEVGREFESDKPTLLSCCGRAEYLTKERLDEINKLAGSSYAIRDGVRTMTQPKTYVEYNGIYGYIAVDVYGNIVSYGQSFLEEDIEAEKIDTNINKNGFRNAADNFIEYLDDKYIIAARVPMKG